MIKLWNSMRIKKMMNMRREKSTGMERRLKVQEDKEDETTGEVGDGGVAVW